MGQTHLGLNFMKPYTLYMVSHSSEVKRAQTLRSTTYMYFKPDDETIMSKSCSQSTVQIQPYTTSLYQL